MQRRNSGATLSHKAKHSDWTDALSSIWGRFTICIISGRFPMHRMKHVLKCIMCDRHGAYWRLGFQRPLFDPELKISPYQCELGHMSDNVMTVTGTTTLQYYYSASVTLQKAQPFRKLYEHFSGILHHTIVVVFPFAALWPGMSSGLGCMAVSGIHLYPLDTHI